MALVAYPGVGPIHLVKGRKDGSSDQAVFGVASDVHPGYEVGSMLLGRARECGKLGELLDAVRRGESRALVLRGEPGVGKSALLDYAVASARDFKVVRAAGAEPETELAFAALHQVCTPLLDRVDQLPEPQREALAIAFGLKTGDVPDPFLIGLGVLSLFSEASSQQPLLCVVDNEQVLDRASAHALAFAARRLFAEPVAIVFATSQASSELAELPELLVAGLRDDDARALVASALAAPLDEYVLDRIVAETAAIRWRFWSCQRRCRPPNSPADSDYLPCLRFRPGSRTDFVGDFRRSRRTHNCCRCWPLRSRPATRRCCGARPSGLRLRQRQRSSTAAGLLEFGARVRFRHPLARSAAYHAASADERLRVHRALAESSIPTSIRPDVYGIELWVPGPDDDIADELERSASLAQARGGMAAASGVSGEISLS